MDTTALAVVGSEEVVSRFGTPLSSEETTKYKARTLRIELAGKDRLEKALIIGEELSGIYNEELFRGADGKRTWEEWVATELVQLLPDEATGKVNWADTRRWLWESRKLLSSSTRRRAELPSSIRQAEAMAALVPRDAAGPAGWQPAILDDPAAAEGIAKVWELACQNAEQNQRRNGPTAEDVRAAREELRPALEQQGLIRSAPAAFQAATAARVEAARQRTVDVTPQPDPAEQERKAAAFRETMANIRDTKAERQAKVEVDYVKEQLDVAERERQHVLQEEVRIYNGRLHGASKAIHELLVYLQTLSRTHGTQLLDEMRCTDVLGLITVGDDMQRLQEMGTELMAAVKLARTSDPSTGISAQTIEV
jgi:hypothetical protein